LTPAYLATEDTEEEKEKSGRYFFKIVVLCGLRGQSRVAIGYNRVLAG
jgi:hypothetical protein